MVSARNIRRDRAVISRHENGKWTMENLFLKIYCGREESKRGKGKVVKGRSVKDVLLVKGKKKVIGEKNNISEVCKKEEKRDDKVKKIDWLLKREKEQMGNYRKRGRLVLSYEPGLVTKGNSKKNTEGNNSL